jgi:hypothetical protein
MKPKTIYILMIICCMGLLSSAKQSGKDCDKTTCNGFTKQKCPKQAQPKTAKEADYDLPPLQLLMYGI